MSQDPHSSAATADRHELFDRIVRDLRPRVFAHIHRIVADPWAADDLTQDAMLKLLMRPALRNPASLRSWIFTVARNLAIDHLHRIRRDPSTSRDYYAPSPEFEAPADPTTPLHLLATKELHADLRRGIDALPEPRRTTLRLCIDDGLDHATAAARLGCPKATVNSRMARSRELLRQTLARHAV